MMQIMTPCQLHSAHHKQTDNVRHTNQIFSNNSDYNDYKSFQLLILHSISTSSTFILLNYLSLFTAFIYPQVHVVLWLRGGLVFSVLDCQLRGLGSKSRPAQKFGLETSAPPVPLTLLSCDEYTDRTLSVGGWDGDGEDRDSPSYTDAKKLKLLTLHTTGCPMASLRDWSSSGAWLKYDPVRICPSLYVCMYVCMSVPLQVKGLTFPTTSFSVWPTFYPVSWYRNSKSNLQQNLSI